MADDTEKSDEITLQQATGQDADVRQQDATDIHFGDLDVDNIYVLPPLDSPATSAASGEYMLGDEGQELSARPEDVSSMPMEETDFAEEVGSFMEELSHENDLDVMFDVSSDSIPDLHPTASSDIGFPDLSFEGTRQLVDLDQLFDAVGATPQQTPFGEVPDHQVSLEDTFWDNTPQEPSADSIPELFESVVAVDPSRALDNIFETLYVADES
ncbi:MAG: hypothetical protein NXI13_16965 [Proteobacteria bacterium]|nr:hypothetical protein [Pseudomonadota bacterium]